MTQLNDRIRNVSNNFRHVKIVIPLAQVDTNADGRLTVTIPNLRHICGAKVDAQPFNYILPS